MTRNTGLGSQNAKRSSFGGTIQPARSPNHPSFASPIFRSPSRSGNLSQALRLTDTRKRLQVRDEDSARGLTAVGHQTRRGPFDTPLSTITPASLHPIDPTFPIHPPFSAATQLPLYPRLTMHLNRSKASSSTPSTPTTPTTPSEAPKKFKLDPRSLLLPHERPPASSSSGSSSSPSRPPINASPRPPPSGGNAEAVYMAKMRQLQQQQQQQGQQQQQQQYQQINQPVKPGVNRQSSSMGEQSGRRGADAPGE